MTKKSRIRHLQSDTIIWQSTLFGQLSNKNEVKGASFIQCLIEVITKCAWKDDIFIIFTKVNKLMTQFNYDTVHPNNIKIPPSTLNSTLKKLFFKTYNKVH